METSEASHSMQKTCFKSSKAKTCGLHSAFFNITKAFCSQWPKCQGTSYYNKVDKVQQSLQIAIQNNYNNWLTQETVKCILYISVLASP